MTIKENQNIIDVCVQQYGSIESLFDFVNQNGLTINSELSSGDVVSIDETLIVDEGVSNFFSTNDLTVVTGGLETLFGDFNDDFNDDFLN